MERMKSEVLARSVKMLKSQEVVDGVLEKWRQSAYVYLFHQDNVNWYYQGIVEKSPSLLIQWSVEKVIEVDIASHKVLKVYGESVKGIEHAQVLDLSDDGERWEGDVLNNQPYGWGVLYDSENRMAYEGFRLNDVNVCYGTRYYSDIQKPEYEGEWFEGNRWGRGIEYNRTGKRVYEGKWLNDGAINKRVVLTPDIQCIHFFVEELVVEDKSCNGKERKTLDFSLFPSIREVRVGDECFKYVDVVKLVGLKRLERVVIGSLSFRREMGYDSKHSFTLKDCENLKELKIGAFSFTDYSVCVIENVPSLEVIEMGDLEEWSLDFCYASLKLSSGRDVQRIRNRLAKTDFPSIWSWCFRVLFACCV